MTDRVERAIAMYGIEEFVPVNSVYMPESEQEGRYVGVTERGHTVITFSQYEVESSGLPMTEE